MTARGERGFALIELLVVLLLVGILVAIAVPTFLSQRQKAQDGEAKYVVSTAATAAEAFFIDGQTHDGMDRAKLAKIEPTLNEGVGASLVVNTAEPASFKLTVDSKSSVKFSYAKDQQSGKATRTCAPANEGTCHSSGKW